MIGDILKDIAQAHNVSVADIRGGRRFRHIVAARHAAIWVLRQARPGMSELSIANAVGLSDHSTVVYVLQKINRLLAEDRAYADLLRAIVATYSGKPSHTPAPRRDGVQRYPGSPDRIAIWLATRKGSAWVESA